MFDTHIKEIAVSDKRYDINLDKEAINAKYVFDSRPSRQTIEMKQIFKGLFIRFDKEIKNFNTQLMDFTEKNEFHFFYCLPMGAVSYTHLTLPTKA